MNILRRELKAGRKAFLFWSLGLFVLVFMGVVKSTGVTADGGGLAALLDSFPRVVLAVFGMAGADIGTFGGFYAVLAQYALVLVAIYAVHLGNSAVSREAVDKTYEFVFTKPRSRSFILAQKLLCALVYLVLYCMLYFVFSAAATATLGLAEHQSALFLRVAMTALLTGVLFFAFGALFAAAAHSTEAGARLGNALVLATFVVGVGYDLSDAGSLLRWFSPFRYFTTAELLSGKLSPVFVVLCLIIAAAALGGAFWQFEKRDLAAR